MPAAGVGGSTAGTGGSAGAATGGTGGSVAGSGGTSGTGGSIGGAGASSGAAGGSGAPQGGAGMGGAAAGMAGMAGAPMGGTSGASGAAGSAGSAGSAGGGAGGGSGTMTLSSPSHMDGAEFADPYTCAEAGFQNSILPQLNWTPGPAGTMSYAITFIDVTLAPEEANGYHWVIYNIPATTTSLPEGFTMASSIGASQNSNYLGPCPNIVGSGNTDEYEFTLYALSQESITIMGSGTTQVRNAETLLEGDNLASAKLTGTSSAAPP
jgi:phosphatidylethanolamine-binding protein (PEBP) family uncharacterized protein